MKIGTFIKIISDAFASQITPSEETRRTPNQLKYQTVLSWFITYGAEENELINKVMLKGKDNYCNKIMNPNLPDDMPITDASYIKGKISSEEFDEVFTEANLDDLAIESLITKFTDEGELITEFNIVDDITSIFHKLLDERSNVNRKFSIRRAVFINDHQVRVGGQVINLPEPLSVPNLPTPHENGYVEALLLVYAQKEKKGTISINDLDTMPVIYSTHLQGSREDFYSAESVLHKVRDLFNDSEYEFGEMKDEVYKGIRYNLNKPYHNGMERVDKVLEYVITISFRKSYFSSTRNGLIGPEEERGMVHMLVSEGRIAWIREELDNENI